MKQKLTGFLVFGLLLLFAVLLASCQQVATPTVSVAETPVTQPQVCPTPAACPTSEAAAPAVDVPFLDLWQNSAHADTTAEAFNHWNEENPAEVPVGCAKCHSSGGFQDYVGADGSEPFVVNAAAPVGTVITCTTCHNQATLNLDKVIFPSGVELTGLGSQAICMTCHQGTASMVQVDAAIEKANVADDDTVSADLGFTNIHYFAAAVTRYGTIVKGGYQYTGKSYDALFEHAGGIDECTECHSSHSLEVQVELCGSCHQGVTTIDDVRKIRFMSSLNDYDGDGNVTESINDEIAGVRDVLMSAMQAYATNVAGTAIAYSPDSYPYFFVDTNANGTVDTDEAKVPNAFKSWTPRLLKAAYNLQTSVKDPGAYAHGGKYIIELLYDSTEDLNSKLGSNAVDMSKMARTDPGHFDGSSEAFRHWDEEGEVPGGCAKCHSSVGLPEFLANGTNIAVPVSNGMKCETCHSSLTTFERYQVEKVKFPSGATLGFEDDLDSNLCLNCHQGRESTTSVNARVKDAPADQVKEGLGFVNVHYFAAGATLFGTEAKGVYEYPGKTYVGRFMHVDNMNSCKECHDAHALAPNTAACQGCHQVDDPQKIRMNSKADYDGDGNATEGLGEEISTMQEKLYAAIQDYAKTKLNTGILYSAASYPYFFVDTNGNGQADEGEIAASNGFKAWSPRLLEAAYNYQYSQKDPGAFAHNALYVMQVLYDSIQDLGGSVTGMTRP